MFDANFFFLLGVLVVLGALAWWRGGPELVSSGLASGTALLVRFALIIVISFLAAGFVEALVPIEWVKAKLGDESGASGILIASAVGIVTPAGPFVSMPLAAVMLKAGVGAAPVVAFLTAWSVVSLHRFVAWEVPILGFSFAAARYAVCIGLPLVAGFLARAVLR